jgi:peptidoglycan/LPS O-acetylase OafA/YrhL
VADLLAPRGATSAYAPEGALSRPTGARDRHLWQIDIVRLLTFAAVILVHSLAYTAEPTDTVAAGLIMILQFGREVFFSLTGFVLIYSTLNRPLKVGGFWRKRFLYVGVPYVVWSLGYYAFSFVSGPHAPFSWHTLGVDLLDGNAEYHLYFLLVSMQLYLVFPLVRGLVLRTRDHPWRVLVPVALANAVWLAAQQWLPWPGGWERFFWVHDYELLPTYAIYVLLGCYAAVHRERLLELLRRHRRRAARGALAGLLLTVAVYAVQTPFLDPRLANQDLQPVMIVGSVSAVLLLAMLGDAWATGRQRGRRAIKVGSDISFGVYLCHPVVLTLLCNAGLGNGLNNLPPGVPTVLAFLGTAAGAVAIGLALRRTPLALPLIGRARARDGSLSLPARIRAVVAARGITHLDEPVQPVFRSR